VSLQTRLAALITAIGADIKEALDNRMIRLQTVTTDPVVDAYWGKITVDYATTGGSSTLLEAKYTGSTDDSSLASFWLNENGAARGAMAKPADVGLKVVGWGTGQSVPTFVVEQRSGNGTGGRSTAWGIDADGNPIIGASEVVGAHVVVIESTDTAPPAGTPPCVVFQKRA
jgi:hypothetical protein